MKEVLKAIRDYLAAEGFERFGDNFVFDDGVNRGRVVVNVQRNRVPIGASFFVNITTGPVAYLEWLAWRNGRPEVLGAGGFGLWRSRLAVPQDAPDRPDPRANWDTWQYADPSDRERVCQLLPQALSQSLPGLKEATDPRAFWERRVQDRTFKNLVALREPLDELLLKAHFDRNNSDYAHLLSVAGNDRANAEFLKWLQEWSAENVI